MRISSFGTFDNPFPDIGDLDCIVLEAVLLQLPLVKVWLRVLFNHILWVKMNAPFRLSFSSTSFVVALVDQEISRNGVNFDVLEIISAHANHAGPLLWNLLSSSFALDFLIIFDILIVCALYWVTRRF